jgi:hypothetical protein
MIRQSLSVLFLLIIQNVFAQNKDIIELTKLNHDWLQSYITKDSTTLNNIFADDFVLISPNGSKMTKSDNMSNLGKQETVSVNIDSIDAKLLTENTGLITAYTTFVLKIDGKEVTGRNCYQDVYVKRKGRWMAVAAHVTLLNMKQY